MIALLGRRVLQPLMAPGVNLDELYFGMMIKVDVAGVPCFVTRTGYTGDLGYEIWVQPDDALAVWDAIVEAGKPYRLEPIGLDALDVLRIEAGFVPSRRENLPVPGIHDQADDGT